MRISDWSSDVCSSDLITVRDAVEIGRTPWLSALQPFSTEDETVVSRALAAVEMQGFAGRHWHTLSGGERQRVHLARALAQQPHVLLLDAPTNHLAIPHPPSTLSLVASLPCTCNSAPPISNPLLPGHRLAAIARGTLVCF